MSRLLLTSNPHIHSGRTTRRVMLDVLIALLPAAVAAVVLFGWRALLVIAVSVAVSVLAEFLFDLACKKEQTVGDLSACVTGLLLALNVPVSIPLWQLVFGDVVAIVVVKCLFGGIGQNFANPAITGRIVMLLCFTGTMVAPTATRFMTLVDGVTGPTPLAAAAAGEATPSLLDLFLGNCGGALGETCAAALLVGFIYLLARRVISWTTPVFFVATVFVFALIVKGSVADALAQILSGGLLLGAIFMATDYATTPLTPLGKIIFGIGCGLITGVIRYFGSLPEGVSYSILLMNILTPFIDKLTAQRPLGKAAVK